MFMKSIIRLMGIVCGVRLLFSVAGAEEDQWELIKSKNGINTYRMTHEGTKVLWDLLMPGSKLSAKFYAIFQHILSRWLSLRKLPYSKQSRENKKYDR